MSYARLPGWQFPVRQPSTLTVRQPVITEDPSTPAVVTASGQTPTLATAAFTPPTGTLVVALVSGGWSNTGTTTATIADSGGHTWTVGAVAVGTVSGFGGIAKIFYTYLATAPGSMTVTGTFGGFGTTGGGKSIGVKVLNGAAADQTAAATASSVITTASTSALITITTTVVGSQVYGVTDQPGRVDAFIPNPATYVISDFANTTDAIEQVAWFAATPTSTPRATTLGGSWSQTENSNTCAFEVLPAPPVTAAAPLPPGAAFLTFA